MLRPAQKSERRHKCRSKSWLAAVFLLLGATLFRGALAQMQGPPTGPLDPARTATLRLPSAGHLTEEFIWTAKDAAAHDPAYQARVRGQDDKTEPHYFRRHFNLRSLPSAATLYIAGPRSATVHLNGQEVLRASDDGTRPKNLSVLTADVTTVLKVGDNVIALQEVRGHSSLHTGASPTINQVTYGEVLAVKIVPAGIAVDAPPVLVSDTQWGSTLNPQTGWQAEAFDDSAWQLVESLGVVGSKRDFLQWNADAGLYAWPGYSGISRSLRVFDVEPLVTSRVGEASLLDFGREISARLRLTSDAGQTVTAVASYGESPEEASANKGYLGTRRIMVAAHGTAFGPKSAFRYVKLTLPQGAAVHASAEAITYPLEYRGSFESSDPTLNRIWETAAYTARLCMQEGIWDGVKRDRGRWMGDLDVTGRSISSVFASPEVNALQAQTMAEIIGDPPVTRDINTIAGYSALWITGEANFYRHTGDLEHLRAMHGRLLGLLAVMDAELDPETHLFTNPGKHKVFVDWSRDLSTDTAEARMATHFEFMMAYREAAFLLHELRDEQHATQYAQRFGETAAAARAHLLQTGTGTFGNRWQTNALAVLAGAAEANEQGTIWQHVLSQVGAPGETITPYHGYYVLSAMAALQHRHEALDWMRIYWGGMLAEGATSFWEAYDPHWPKQDFHAFLEADNKRGYYVSLAHGWASGPAAWLPEEVLGIQPTAGGFQEVTIRPDLAGLQWARGGEPTPRGLLLVDLKPDQLIVTLPSRTHATVLLPFDMPAAGVRMNGHTLPTTTSRAGDRLRVTLQRAGTYTFRTHP